ncbi:cell division protein FtsL [Lactobacillus mulieris]|uniref:cell division protein FtsL n=1 Tax=Lactobacillus mulieris TaxID=2508708 RepID=UPI001432B3CD|nr:cell division protein FtsL [Lactobacillus mulieris]MCF1783220.1 cell division protein FtsL [Lactobacillus mulieris]MCW8103969.1 cell division protein FtsL [Lactobacillus mulieris]MDK6803037.1 cell division protein FtsL [Lactobacillus mulieris]MDK8382155.1 cell division protein FtsL [Lactobacillus mulieris]MDT9620216.1 cell division protein FtsL [Lactobacillus mulieris]
MADSSARNLNYNYEPSRKARSTFETERRMSVDPNKVPFSWSEIFILIAGSIVTIAMAAMLVFTSVAATSAQHQLANIQTELTSSQTDSSNLRQEIGELTSSSRMNKIAKQEGLSLIESNIRTVD